MYLPAFGLYARNVNFTIIDQYQKMITIILSHFYITKVLLTGKNKTGIFVFCWFTTDYP